MSAHMFEPGSRSRRWMGRLALLTSALALAELGAGLAYRAATGEWLRYRRLGEQRRARAGEAMGAAKAQREGLPPAPWLAEEVVHPFVGYVLRPRSREQEDLPFPFSAPLFQPPTSGRLLVLLVGGSVAGQLESAQSRFAAVVASAAAGRQVVVVNLAHGGYKQPQQLQLLAYLLSLGAHADVVVNLDGYNEVVLPWADNGSVGVFPAFPRSWNLRLLRSSETAVVRETGAIVAWRDVAAAVARAFEARPWRWSVTANATWFLLDQWIATRLHRHEAALRAAGARPSYERLGPRVALDRARALELAADVWERSSIAMHHLATGAGVLYVHVLQPNQHLEGSKPLSGEERRRFHRPSSPYGALAREGLPLLRARAGRLRAAGVRFHDLTQLFADERRTVYSDACCHFDALGLERLALRLGQVVAEALRAPRPAAAAEAPPRPMGTREHRLH